MDIVIPCLPKDPECQLLIASIIFSKNKKHAKMSWMVLIVRLFLFIGKPMLVSEISFLLKSFSYIDN